MPSTTRRRSSSRVITYAVLNRFQAGISAKPDKVAMPPGASPMARNVEWHEVGGFTVRRGVGALVYGTVGEELVPPGQIPVLFYHYVRDPSSVSQFLSQYFVALESGKIVIGVDFGPQLGTTAAGAWHTLQVASADVLTDGPPVFTAWDTNVYISLGVAATSAVGKSMLRWNGSVGTALGVAWNDDITNPVGGNMPPARYVTAWAERLWVAATFVAGGFQGSSLRWSHPGQPEDWAQDDEITVGQAGDVITGIAPMRDMLVVFKRSSTYALLGSGATNFRIVPISGTIGSTGQWTSDNQGAIVFWDGTLGLCRFDGKGITNLFEPLLGFIKSGASGSITRCGGVVTDGERIYVATDFQDFYGDRVPTPVGRRQVPEPMPRAGQPLVPGLTTWGDLVTSNVAWAASAGQRWLQIAAQFYNMVWVYRSGAGWTSFGLSHPTATAITMLGQLRSRLAPTGDVQSNRRIVYGLAQADVPIYMSDRYDDGTDWWTKDTHGPIDAFYMTPWLHGGLPAQIKRWKAPRVIQEADQVGILLIDVYYDFNYDFLRRTLRVGVVTPLSFDSYSVGKPGTIGRAKAVMLVIRPEHPRHWGVSSITVPIHPKVMR